MSIKVLLMLVTALMIMAQAGIAADRKTETATFAGGCFWCMEYPFESRDGVIDVISGYTGGKEERPSYKEVSSGTTGHMEAVQITYDPEKISYSELLDIFWMQIDPTDAGGQFVDRGSQYITAIFYHTPEQKELAEKSRAELAASGQYDDPIVTEIVEATPFYRAEGYHQDFYKKNPMHYNRYRSGSGRDRFLEKIWGKKNRH